LVVAMAIRSHVLVSAAIGGYPVGEQTLAAQLLTGLPTCQYGLRQPPPGNPCSKGGDWT
jgi:hypothetical protein